LQDSRKTDGLASIYHSIQHIHTGLHPYPRSLRSSIAILATCCYNTTASRYFLQLAEMGILREAVVGKYHPFANHQLLSILGK
jgi:hypothetical protein